MWQTAEVQPLTTNTKSHFKNHYLESQTYLKSQNCHGLSKSQVSDSQIPCVSITKNRMTQSQE